MKFKVDRNQVKLFAISIITCSLLFSITNCSKSADSATTTTTSLSAFATVIAQELTLASPTSQAGSAGASAANDVSAMKMPDGGSTADEKSTALVSLLSSPATCAISITLVSAGRANCYGPSVSYTGHEFNASAGSWPSGDLGIWEPTEVGTSEACVSA
ncbi:MAG: hypothetical protein WA160_11965 [Pseudobdellovibrio sp.]